MEKLSFSQPVTKRIARDFFAEYIPVIDNFYNVDVKEPRNELFKV